MGIKIIEDEKEGHLKVKTKFKNKKGKYKWTDAPGESGLYGVKNRELIKKLKKG